jgi:NADPH-dependent ferric siderophore reductase
MTTTGEPTDADAAVAEVAPLVLAGLNAEYGDSVAFLARVLGGRPAPTAAEAVGLDRHGVDLAVTDAEGTHACRLAFAEPADDPAALVPALLALVAQARRQSGEPGQTSAERMAAEMAGIRTFLTSVSAVRQVGPHLRSITFAGGDLDTFAPLGPDTFLYVLLPPPGRTELTIDRDFQWTQVESMPEDERPVGAYYTLRRWSPATADGPAWVEVLAVLHGDEGPASAWAARAEPGQPVALWGPRTAWAPPPGTDRYLLVADETGLPAVAVILETLPAGTPVRVVAEVGEEADRPQLPTGESVEVTWVQRAGRAPGTTTLLAEAARAAAWDEGTPYAWGGAESRAMTATRRFLRQERGLAREQVSMVAYWRHPQSPEDAGD